MILTILKGKKEIWLSACLCMDGLLWSPIPDVTTEQELSAPVWWAGKKGLYMRKDEAPNELRPEYKREDLGKGTRGKYFEDYRKGTNLVLLSPDVAEVFSTDEAVNEALRSLIRLAEKSTRRAAHTTGPSG
jgi:hypothetical protein